MADNESVKKALAELRDVAAEATKEESPDLRPIIEKYEKVRDEWVVFKEAELAEEKGEVTDTEKEADKNAAEARTETPKVAPKK